MVTNEAVGLLKVDTGKPTSHGEKCELIAFAEKGRQTQAEGLRACIRSTCMRGGPNCHPLQQGRQGWTNKYKYC